MKKFFVIVCLFFCTLCTYALNISLSDGDFGMDADVIREGDNIRMKYIINGMNAIPAEAQIPDEQRNAVSQIGDVRFEVLASCTSPKLKVISMDVYDLTGKLISSISDTDWVYIEKQEDIAKLKQLCSKV